MTNAILHAEAGPEEQLRLDVHLDTSTLRVSVTDPGRGFDPPPPSNSDGNGWGLYIVDRLSHRWGVDRVEGTCVWFEMPIAARAEADATAEERDAEHHLEERGEESQVRRRRAVPRLRLRPQITL